MRCRCCCRADPSVCSARTPGGGEGWGRVCCARSQNRGVGAANEVQESRASLTEAFAQLRCTKGALRCIARAWFNHPLPLPPCPTTLAGMLRAGRAWPRAGSTHLAGQAPTVRDRTPSGTPPACAAASRCAGKACCLHSCHAICGPGARAHLPRWCGAVLCRPPAVLQHSPAAASWRRLLIRLAAPLPSLAPQLHRVGGAAAAAQAARCAAGARQAAPGGGPLGVGAAGQGAQGAGGAVAALPRCLLARGGHQCRHAGCQAAGGGAGRCGAWLGDGSRSGLVASTMHG